MGDGLLGGVIILSLSGDDYVHLGGRGCKDLGFLSLLGLQEDGDTLALVDGEVGNGAVSLDLDLLAVHNLRGRDTRVKDHSSLHRSV